MEWESFARLPDAAVAELLEAANSTSLYISIDGTRRWYMAQKLLERIPHGIGYAEFTVGCTCTVLASLLRAGFRDIIVPSFLPANFDRGSEYINEYFIAANEALLSGPFGGLASEFGLRVHFYGAMTAGLSPEQDARLNRCRKLLEERAVRERARVYFGQAPSLAEALQAGVGVMHEGPRSAIAAYYGHEMPLPKLAIVHGEPRVAGAPLILEDIDIYTLRAPTIAMQHETVRRIVYDHLFERRPDDSAYEDVNAAQWVELGHYYEAGQLQVMGLGKRELSDHIWIASD